MKYLIVGAGPTGLTLACKLLENKNNEVILLEKEEVAGGLCRSEDVDGSPLDIGGGHFLDVRRPKVNEFVFSYMGKDEWDFYERDSRIIVNGNIINSPIEANIWQMKLEDQVEYLKAIAVAGCNLGKEMPEKFIDWITWKLGSKVAEDYMIPYNQKMFGENLNELGTYWLEKLPNVSFDETLISCLTHKAYGTQPGHAQFYYPKKYGYGEVWIRMADSLGDKLKTNVSAVEIDLDKKVVNGEYEADVIINTSPWIAFEKIHGLSDELKSGMKCLKKSSIVVDYYGENMDTKCQWLYYPDPKLSYHRILVRHNFCPNSKGYWTETNSDRSNDNNKSKIYSYTNEYAYPLNTIGKQEYMKALLEFTEKKNVYGLGRWGEWQHYNSDVVVERAMNLADKLNNN